MVDSYTVRNCVSNYINMTNKRFNFFEIFNEILLVYLKFITVLLELN